MFAISNVVRAAIGSYVGQSVKTDKTKTKTLDTLQAEGVTSQMLVAPAKGEDRALFDSLKAAVVSGFEVRVQALLVKDVKTLDDSAKTDRKFWQQQIGSKMKDIKNGLAKREAPEQVEGEGEGEGVATFESRLKRDLCKYIAQIEKGEAFEFTVIEMLKHLKNASALIK